MTPARNVFRTPPGARSHTIGDVTRAGEFLRNWAYHTPRLDPETANEQIEQAVEAFKVVHWWRDQHARPLNTASQGLRYHVGNVVEDQPQVSQRLKRVPTMVDKLERYKGNHMELGRMWDIGGVRARLPNVDAVYEVAQRLSRWKIRGKAHDYISNPKPDGYRAYHLYVEKNKRVIEIQLRTELQDTWANQVERDGRMGAAGYKFGRGKEAVLTYYRTVSEIFAAQDAGLQVDPALREKLNRSYDELQRISDTQEK
ncbi:MAG: pyrophosphokinae [Actinomycetota bacterium]|jgi:ppGpp synthetase/RelA/SpoT-type nucleotidyltranferase|nr:pyrophosphokinae [Actinomycetota bacterium]